MFTQNYSKIKVYSQNQLIKVKNLKDQKSLVKKVFIGAFPSSLVSDIRTELENYLVLTQNTQNSASKTLLKIKEIIIEEDYLYIVMEYCKLCKEITEGRL